MNCLKVQDVPIAYFEDFMEVLSIINFLFVDFYVQLLDSRNIMKLAPDEDKTIKIIML